MADTATERALEFRVGLFVAGALGIIAVMIFQFGNFDRFWEQRYTVAVHFDRAPGIHRGSPVRLNGIPIGRVRDLVIDPQRGGVTVLTDINAQYTLKADTQPELVRSLLGDATIEFTPGRSPDALPRGSIVEGTRPAGLDEVVRNMDRKVAQTLDAFAATSREWQQVAANVNGVLGGHREQIDRALTDTVAAIGEFHRTMQTANRAVAQLETVLADPAYRDALRKTLEQLPQIAEETRVTIAAARRTIGVAEQNLDNLNRVTAPLADNAADIAVRSKHMIAELDRLAVQLNQFAETALSKDGTLQRFASDPRLYENLNQSAASLSVLLENLQPVVADLRIFADKVARHPEVIGVKGALRGSSGIK